MACSLEYIPERLHTNDKPILESFSIGEELYYRCKSEVIQKPYDRISLYDISHNRNFNNSKIYLKNDVLFNIIEDDPRELYENLDIVVLTVQNMQGQTTYFKEIISRDNDTLKATIKLKHSPIPCMYPHSVFEISVNDIVVDSMNYKQILNRDNRTFKNLRSDIRQELTSIIQTGNIDLSKETEFIDEP